MKRMILLAVTALICGARLWSCIKLPPEPGEGGTPPPEVKNLVSPADGASADKRRDTTFKWRAASGVQSYMWAISTSSNFQSAIILSKSTGDTSIVLSSTEPAITAKNDFYYWSVSGVNAGGVQGPWVTPNRIKVIKPEISVDVDTPIVFQPVYVKNFDDIIVTECRRDTFTIRNRGIGDLQLLTVRFQIPAYALVKADSFFNLAQGATSQVIVRFQPRSAPGDRNDALQIKYSVLGGEEELLTIPFEGESQDFPEEGSDPVYDFGNPAGNSSAREFCIANKLSNNSLTLTLAFSGGDENDFSANPETLVLAGNGNPDATKGVIITFSPQGTAIGSRQAFLNIRSSSVSNNLKGKIKFKGVVD